MQRLPHLAQKLFNTPLALHPGKAELVMAALADRFGVTQCFRASGEPMLLVSPDLMADDRAENRPYDVVAGVAIIQIEGTLVQKLGCIQPYSGMTGYDGIRALFLHAIEDDDVRAIALQIDSPGGDVSGCFDLADTIYAARGRKPVWAILDEAAYSAAYALASAADRIVVPRSGGAGSIGVIAMLADMSKALDKAGVTVNIIQFGARKADGNPYEALPEAARARFQAQIDAMGELFVATVARNRGISPAAVRATEAATFMAAEAVELRLADAVMAPDAAFSALVASLG